MSKQLFNKIAIAILYPFIISFVLPIIIKLFVTKEKMNYNLSNFSIPFYIIISILISLVIFQLVLNYKFYFYSYLIGLYIFYF